MLVVGDDLPLIDGPGVRLLVGDDFCRDILARQTFDFCSGQLALIDAHILVRRCLHRIAVVPPAEPERCGRADRTGQCVAVDFHLLQDAVDVNLYARRLTRAVAGTHHMGPPAARQCYVRVGAFVGTFGKAEGAAGFGRADGLHGDGVLGPVGNQLHVKHAVAVVEVPPAIAGGDVHLGDQRAGLGVPSLAAGYVARLDPTATRESLVLLKVAVLTEVYSRVRLQPKSRPEAGIFAPMRFGAGGGERRWLGIGRTVVQQRLFGAA